MFLWYMGVRTKSVPWYATTRPASNEKALSWQACGELCNGQHETVNGRTTRADICMQHVLADDHVSLRRMMRREAHRRRRLDVYGQNTPQYDPHYHTAGLALCLTQNTKHRTGQGRGAEMYCPATVTVGPRPHEGWSCVHQQ